MATIPLSRAKSLPALNRREEGFDHLSVDVVAVELIRQLGLACKTLLTLARASGVKDQNALYIRLSERKALCVVGPGLSELTWHSLSRESEAASGPQQLPHYSDNAARSRARPSLRSETSC